MWEFLTNFEVAQLVIKYYFKNKPEEAANALVKKALHKWKEEEDVIDDITCVIIFLKDS